MSQYVLRNKGSQSQKAIRPLVRSQEQIAEPRTARPARIQDQARRKGSRRGAAGLQAGGAEWSVQITILMFDLLNAKNVLDVSSKARMWEI